MKSELPGELMMIGFEGTHITPQLADWITKRHVGGLIFFARNLGLMPHVAALIAELQALRAKVSAQPLFIAIDQEGGVVSRHIPGMTVLPGNMALGGIGSEDSAFAAGRITSVEMGLLGFNVNLAPVMDLSCEPGNLIVGVRSFGQDPLLVKKLGASMIEGMQTNGMLATAKHFPGLGRCAVDPHQDLPIVSCQEEGQLKDGLEPFAGAVAAGVRIVMSAHAVFRYWEKDAMVPATLSRTILQDVLRGQLNFKGVILSDDIEMQALTKYFSIPEITRRSVQAGVNMLSVCHSHQRQMESFNTLSQMLGQKGQIEGRIEESLKRVREAKRFLTQGHNRPQAGLNMIDIHREVAQRMGRDSITLIRDDAGRIPVRLKDSQKLLLLLPRYDGGMARTDVEGPRGENSGEESFLDLFRQVHPHVQLRRIDPNPTPEDFKQITESLSYDLVLLLTYNAHLFPRQMEFAKKLLEKKKEVIVVAIRNPYDVMELDGAQTVLATYGFRDCSMKALADVLSGEIIPKGKMPVSL